MRNTKKDGEVENIGRSFPLSQDPDMIALKKLVRALDPERRRVLQEELERLESEDAQLRRG